MAELYQSRRPAQPEHLHEDAGQIRIAGFGTTMLRRAILTVASGELGCHHPPGQNHAYKEGDGMDHTPQALVFGAAALLALGSGALAQDVSQVDLTGTWEGTQVCDELVGGEFANFVIVDNPLLVVQDGERFRFVYIGESEDEVADDLVYEGVVQDVEGADHSEAMASVCGGDYDAEEIVRLRRIEISEDGGRFDAESIFFTDDYPPAEGVLDFLTCKWAYERVSSDRPRVPRCERPGIRAPH